VAINGGKARAADADVKALADNFEMTNIASPEAGKPAIRPAPGVELRSFRPNGAPGWVGQYAVNADGQVGAACVPTGITARMSAKNIIDRPLRANAYDIKQEVGAGSEFQGRWGDSAMIKAAMDKLK
jgi:hypothetical protein